MERLQYNRIQEVLEEKNRDVYWLQSQMKEQTIPCVVRWCKNVKQPTIEEIFEIARVLEVDVRELLASTTTQKLSSLYRNSVETLNHFQGKDNVRHIVSDNGSESWLTQEVSFADEAYAKRACGLNTVENEKKHVLFLFNDKEEEVGRYYMAKKLQGKTPDELIKLKNNLSFFESWNPESKNWIPSVGLSDKHISLAKVSSCKEGCGLTTILKNGHYYVIDKDNNYIVPPGKYDYIDGFDKCGLARVKIDGKADISDPEKTTYDRWGLIDTKGNEILPLEYSEIWSFYNKGRKSTKVYWGGFDENGDYDKFSEAYLFILPWKELPKGKLKGPGEWFGSSFQSYDEIDASNSDYNYSVWDALDGEPEAAGNIDYEW